MVLSAARQTGFDEQRALDVVQDTFMKAIRAMPVITTDAQLDAWLRRVALRTALDHLRTERRRAKRDRAHATTETSEHDARAAVLRKELATMKRSTIELLQLRHQAGLTLDAIARRVGSTTGAVDGRLRRAATKLGARLKENDA